MEQSKIAGGCHFYLDRQTVEQYQNTIFPSDLKGNDSHPVGPIRGQRKIVLFSSSLYPTARENELYLWDTAGHMNNAPLSNCGPCEVYQGV